MYIPEAAIIKPHQRYQNVDIAIRIRTMQTPESQLKILDTSGGATDTIEFVSL